MIKKRLIVIFISILLLVSCNNVEENSTPVIEGVNDIECIVNSTVDLLNGVVAYDLEQGDITPEMTIAIAPSVDVYNGYAVFDEAGNYKITYKVLDDIGNAAETSADITVIDRETYLDLSYINGFYVTTSGHATLEKGGMYNNEYLILAHNCEVAEDVAVNRVYNLDSGYDYTFTYYLQSEHSGRVRIMVDNYLLDEKLITSGDNTITFTYNTTNKSNVTISLLLGALAEDVNCVFKGAKLSRPQETGEVELMSGFQIIERFDATSGSAYMTSDGYAKLEITEASSDIWRGGMFINTNVQMEVGKEYKVSFDIERKEALDCEVVLKYQQWDEFNYETFYFNNNELTASYEANLVITEDNTGVLWFYVQSGHNVNEIIIKNISVKTYLSGNKEENIELADFTSFNDGFNCSFETFSGGFRYYIEAFGDVDWQQKVTSPAFYINGSGSNFIITFKAKASKPTEVVFAGPKADGWDPTWVWSKFTITEEEKVYSFICGEAGSDRYNALVWQFGSVNNQKYNNVTIEISDIRISYLNSEYDGE